jgi:hypothetical protein
MKPLIPILAVATTSLAVASVQYAQQASTERKRAEAEIVLRQKQETRIAELERTQARLERDLAVAQETLGAPPAPSVATNAPSKQQQKALGQSVRGAVAGAFAVAADGAPPPTPGVFTTRRHEMSPAARNFMRTRMKNSLRRQYEDVGPALGLSRERANEFIDLVADQQTRNFDSPPPQDAQSAQDMQKYFRDQQRKNEAEIASFLGQDKLDEWTNYQQSMPDRMQLAQVRDQLEQAGLPMSESQRSEMLSAIAEERDRNPRPTPTSGLPPDEMAMQMNRWQSDYEKALYDRAKQVLTSEQFKSYKEYFDWQQEMRNSFRPPAGVALQDYAVSNTITAVGSDTNAVSVAVPLVVDPVESRK